MKNNSNSFCTKTQIIEYDVNIPLIRFTTEERMYVKELWELHKNKYKIIKFSNGNFVGYRKSILMILELINLVVISLIKKNIS